jgi:hypothetical protein
MATQAMGVQAGQTAWGGVERTAYNHLVLDIETRNAPEEWAKAEFALTYKTPSNYKDPLKVKRHKEEAWAKTLDKLALLPCSPIPAIGLKSETELRCLHCMWEHEPMTVQMGEHVALVESFEDERAMLKALQLVMGVKVDLETVLVGFNCRYFDFPALRRALARENLAIPKAMLNPEQPLFDCMEKYCRLFMGTREIFCSCAECSVGLGIEPNPKSGREVPEMFASGDYEEIVKKVLYDVVEEEQQFLRMTGR